MDGPRCRSAHKSQVKALTSSGVWMDTRQGRSHSYMRLGYLPRLWSLLCPSMSVKNMIFSNLYMRRVRRSCIPITEWIESAIMPFKLKYKVAIWLGDSHITGACNPGFDGSSVRGAKVSCRHIRRWPACLLPVPCAEIVKLSASPGKWSHPGRDPSLRFTAAGFGHSGKYLRFIGMIADGIRRVGGSPLVEGDH